MKNILAIVTASVSWVSFSHAEDRCPVCQGALLDVTKQQDDRSKPSINLAVWNRSFCGNGLFGSGSTICPRDGYAYEANLKRWKLSLEDRDSFKHPLDPRIHEFPLPDKNHMKSATVYSQDFETLAAVKHEILFWTVIDKGFFAKVREYAKTQGIHLNIEPHNDDGQAIVTASVTQKSPEEEHAEIAEQKGWLENYQRGNELLRKLLLLTREEQQKLDNAAHRGEKVAFVGTTAPPGGTDDLMTERGFYLRIVNPEGKDLAPPNLCEAFVCGEVWQVYPENKIVVMSVRKKDWLILKSN